MKDLNHKDLYDMYYRDLKIINSTLFDWIGVTIPIETLKYKKIKATISILPELLSYLFGDILHIYKTNHYIGYVEVSNKAKIKTNGENYKIYQFDISTKEHKIYFNLYIYWNLVLSSRHINLEGKIDFNNPPQLMLLDSKYLNHNIFRSESRKKLSIVNYEKLIPSHFSHFKKIPDLVRLVLDKLPILDNSIRELENEDIYIFPKFDKRPPDYEFGAYWDVNIIPKTVMVRYNKLGREYVGYLPSIGFSVTTY